MFFIDVPVAAAVVALVLWKVSETRNPDARRLDVSGAIAVFIGLGGIIWALIEGPKSGLGRPGGVERCGARHDASTTTIFMGGGPVERD